ncbi:MAG TPA: hypothetical protein VGI39_38145 [Polyangiaceae bacterium]|jgi:uncharacterized Zn finger protein
MAWYEYRPYVSVAERRQKGEREAARRLKKGEALAPVTIPGRKIASTFWGAAWCDHLESYSDFETRLPRGRSYVKNGSVIHLNVAAGKVSALVQGTELYEVTVTVAPLEKRRWTAVVEACAGQIDSLVELLQGKLSRGVMEVVTHRDKGLFPAPAQIEMKCTCPDWATMCKHVAAALYGVGARLDEKPELLFVLRDVDHLALIEKAGAGTPRATSPAGKEIAEADLASIFGIEIDTGTPSAAPKKRAKAAKKSARKRLRVP